MTRYLVDGAHYDVETFGRAAGHDGVPLVLLHGFTGSAESWQTLAAALGAHGRPVGVDLLGHGKSDSPADSARYQADRGVADLLTLFDRLGLDRVHLLGYSMGGRLALQLASFAPHRLRSLVLESASPGIADPNERTARVRSDEALADFAEREGIAAFVDRWERVPLFASQAALPAERRARLRAQRLRNDPRGLANSLRGFGAGMAPPMYDRLAAIDVPTLIVVGELDAKYCALGRAMAAAMLRARLAIVPDAGHTVHLEQPAAFERLVIEFLGELRDALTPTLSQGERG